MRQHCEWAGRQQQEGFLDANSVFASLQREGTSSRADRRTAIEIAIISETLQSARAPPPRWIPHPRMPAYAMTKVDCTKVYKERDHLLRMGTLAMRPESQELQDRASDPAARSRTQASSARFIEEKEPLRGVGRDVS